MTGIQVVALIAAVLAAVGLAVLAVVLAYRRRYRAAVATETAQMAADGIVRAFEKGVYRGATAPGYPAVNNNGRIALTRKRLVFVTLTGVRIEIPLDAITGLRQSTVFKSSVAGGYTHLVVATAAGEIGFYVSDLPAWLHALADATGVAPAPS